MHVGILTYVCVCAELLWEKSEPSSSLRGGVASRCNRAPVVALAGFIVPPGPISPTLWETEGQGEVSCHFSEWEGPPLGLP